MRSRAEAYSAGSSRQAKLAAGDPVANDHGAARGPKPIPSTICGMTGLAMLSDSLCWPSLATLSPRHPVMITRPARLPPCLTAPQVACADTVRTHHNTRVPLLRSRQPVPWVWQLPTGAASRTPDNANQQLSSHPILLFYFAGDRGLKKRPLMGAKLNRSIETDGADCRVCRRYLVSGHTLKSRLKMCCPSKCSVNRRPVRATQYGNRFERTVSARHGKNARHYCAATALPTKRLSNEKAFLIRCRAGRLPKSRGGATGPLVDVTRTPEDVD